MSSADHVHIDLDGAWPSDLLGSAIDCRTWGPRLRYCARRREMEDFYTTVEPHLAPFTLFGSGDFHHLSALWLRRVQEPFTLISFDNHPDWDIRPPYWGCGTWMNRALQLPHLREIAIWGCGNFEMNWPGYLFVSRRALAAHRIAAWPWIERLDPSGRERWRGTTRHDWRHQFTSLVQRLAEQAVYVTVDLDCITEAEATTNWEQGLFTAADIVWALGELRSFARIIGGDLCGAASEPTYARRIQRFLANRDHPTKSPIPPGEAQERNLRAFSTIWLALTRRD